MSEKEYLCSLCLTPAERGVSHQCQPQPKLDAGDEEAAEAYWRSHGNSTDVYPWADVCEAYLVGVNRGRNTK